MHPFSNGTEYGAWTAANCDRCQFGYSEIAQHWPCDLEKAINSAYVNDGSIAMDIAERIGLSIRGDLCTRCHEYRGHHDAE